MQMTYVISVDEGKNLIRVKWKGNWDTKVAEEGYRELIKVIRKFPKNEALIFWDLSNTDIRLMSSEAGRVIEEWNAIAVPLCRKWASAISSFVFQKSLEHGINAFPNARRYATEEEAMKWLLEK